MDNHFRLTVSLVDGKGNYATFRIFDQRANVGTLPYDESVRQGAMTRDEAREVYRGLLRRGWLPPAPLPPKGWERFKIGEYTGD